MPWYNTRKFYRLTFLVIMALVIFYFMLIMRSILLPFIIGFLVAYLLNPMVERLEQKKIPRIIAILIVFFAVLSFFAIIGIFGFPKIIAELNKFADAIPAFTKEVQSVIRNIQNQYSQFTLPESFRHVLDESVTRGENLILDIVTNTVNGILSLFSHFFSLLISPIVTFYILKDLEKIKKGVYSALPKKYRSDIVGLLRDIDEVVFKFIKGNLLVGTLVGVLVSLGMAIVGVRFSVIIGIVAGITNLIPFLGPFIGAVPAVLLALLQSKIMAFYAILVVFVVQQFEGNIISPKILGDSVGLHPLWVIFSLLAGGQLLGILGMIIAVPIAAIVKVLVRFLFLRLV